MADTSATPPGTGGGEGSASAPPPPKNVPQPPSEVPQPPPEVPQPQPEVPQPPPEVSQSPPEITQPPPEVQHPPPEVPQPPLEVPQSVPEVPQPTPEVPQPTSVGSQDPQDDKTVSVVSTNEILSSEPVPDVKTEDLKDDTKLNEETSKIEIVDKELTSSNKEFTTEGWEKREQELLKKIEELEKGKGETKEDSLKLQLKVREEEIDLFKARVKNLETELQAAFSKPGAKNTEMIEHIKQQHEELLTKARGMIFDKTKLVKNQELQIEALTTQVQSLKDINLITKDLLEIRNSEVKAMEERLEAMEARFKAEKERFTLVLQRAQTSTGINDDLRKEYETQLAIFKELREKYEQRVKALVAENERLKAPAQGGSSG